MMFSHSDFMWILGSYLFRQIWGKYIIKIGKRSTKIHEIGKINAIFELGMTPIIGSLFVFVALRPKSTAMVITGRSVHLTTFFPGQA